jgi:hypothetical protein
MNNKDLITQYVDTGLELPEYQISQLPSWAMKTYIRKRLIATKNGQTDNSYLNDYELSKLDKKTLDNYYNNRTKHATHLRDFEVKYLDKKLAYNYAVNKAEKGYQLNDEFFKILPDNLKLKFINTRLEKNNPLSTPMLYFGGEEVIDTYLKKQIKGLDRYSRGITFMRSEGKNRDKYPSWYENLDDKLKTKVIWMMMIGAVNKSLAVSYFDIDDEIYTNIPLELRKKYLKNLIADKDENLYLSSKQFNDLDEEDKYLYVKKRFEQDKNGYLSKAELAYLDKDIYIQQMIDSGGYLTDDEFNSLTTKQKFDYVKKRQEKGEYIYTHQQPYIQ